MSTSDKALPKRLVDRDGVAGTLMSSYRRSPALYSQFVADARLEGAAALEPPPRFFTERECLRLQGFPDDFVIGDFGKTHRAYHIIGNAVVPPVVRRIADALLRALEAEPPGERGSQSPG